jgi:predicted nucleic acid-binding protein
MTLTLELPQDLERRLTTEASRLGLPLEKYALRLLGESPQAEPRPTTGAELVAYWRREGVIGSRPDIADSQAHARTIRHRAERRLGRYNLGLLDALVAACALGHSATLLTFNAKHYRVISGLRLEQPYKR